MSFNRGMKRNSFGNNRPFNQGNGGGRNLGGGGGGMGGSGGGSPGNRGVSPWESGVMPPGRGILPTPNNNLSLNSPQAQLVIASNLLSNLLRTQQDSSPPVPSLLSLGNSMNSPGSNFRGQQGFSSPGRFNDRQPTRSSMKSQQRSQPYNKMGNRARDGVAGRRGPSSSQQSRAQSGNQRANGNQNQHRNDKNSKANTAKQNQTSKKEQQDVKNSDKEKPNTETIVKSDEKAGEKEEKKSEVKTEKDDGETAAMETSKTEEKTTGEGKEAADKPESPDKKKDDGSGKKSEARHADSRYAAVPINSMSCHVCNKQMWDGFSFENHLRGRAHQIMMDKRDESYKLKVDLMRHELRVSEEQRAMSLNNSKRRGKRVSVDLSVREYCPMCDLNFYGTLSNHRKSDKHQQLKLFLHPRCHPCVKEFPSRIEYDEHCLTPTHMVAAAQNEEQKKSKKNKLPKGESEVRTAEDEEKDAGPDPKASDTDEELPENNEYLTDITDNMDMTKFKIPSYKYCRHKQLGVGASMVKEAKGYHCEKCRRFMLTPEDMAVHLKTRTHHRNFVHEVKSLTAPPPSPEKAEKTSESKEKEPTDKEEGEREAKRPKLDEESKEEKEEVEKSSEEEKTTEQKEASTDDKDEDEGEGDEKYDPMDAVDGESEEEKDKTGKEGEEEEKSQKEEDKVADVWEDIDNEDESEVGNLIDGDEKTEVVPSTPQSKSQPQSTSTPAPATTPATPTIPTPPEPPIISKTPTNSTPNHSSMNNSGNKGRGRGFRGGGNRGHQRARRSRR